LIKEFYYKVIDLFFMLTTIQSYIQINGARENNLKNIDLDIPRNKIVAIIGVSGSGKSTLAYNILYSEGQRQFLESINTFASRLLKKSQKAAVDSIINLSPTISVDQKKLRGNPRSTVGTTTELYTSLRLLFSRFGSVTGLSAGDFSFNNPKGACKQCKGLGVEYNIDPNKILEFNKSLADGASQINNYKPGKRLYNIIESSQILDVNKKISQYTKEELDLLLYSERIELSNDKQGFIQRFSHEGIITRLKKRAMDLRGISKSKEKTEMSYLSKTKCSMCEGSRLSLKALKSTINGENIGYYSDLQINDLIKELSNLHISGGEELLNRLLETSKHLLKVKLDYLSLNRGLDTLSGGESQRIKLAKELGNDLIEMVYILDEPTSGLHNHDREHIIDIISSLRDKGNSVIVIEHDEEVIKNADYIIEIGPKAGNLGGAVTFTGTYPQLIEYRNSYKNSDNLSKSNKKRRLPIGFLEVKNANVHNLKNVTCKVPMGVLCTFTGVSGSGKSTLLMDVFAKKYKDKVIVVDQKQLQGTARGNVATYIGVFDKIRDLFALKNNVSKSLFSFNSTGACPNCKGVGYKKLDMHFMGDVIVKCEMCGGNRYKESILQYKFNGKNIKEILDLTVDEAYLFFEQADIKQSFETLQKVGLGYITLGQSHNTFSGGEGQRLKLAKQLNKSGEIYILDEPTSGLHKEDIKHLLLLINELVDNGNTVLAIEHNMNFIEQSDWIIDLGLGGGDKGGEIVVQGTPEDIVKDKTSYTGIYLSHKM